MGETVSNITRRENNNIDLIRLLAATMVVFGHSFGLAGSGWNYLDQLCPHGQSIHGLGVSVFFFLSGLLVTNSILRTRSAVSFATSRLFRILPAYIAVIIISVFCIGPLFTTVSTADYFSSNSTWFFLCRNLIFDVKYSLPGVFESNPYVAVDGSLWSLPLEIGCYIIVLCVFVLCSRLKIPSWIPLSLFIILSLVPHEALLSLFGIGYSLIDSQLWFCFAIGSLFAVYKDRIVIDNTLVVIMIVACTFTWRYQNVIYYLFPITISIVFLYVSSVRPLLMWKPKHDISYGIYIWHWPIMQILIVVLGLSNAYLLFLVSYAICLVVAYLSCRLIEEPSIAVGKRISKKLTSRASANVDNGMMLLGILLCSIILAKCLL